MKPDTTEYKGVRERDGSLFVSVDGKALRHIIKHSPTGMESGYGGSGPADTALSILADFLESRPEVEQTFPDYQDFKWSFIAQADRQAGFVITGQQIREWLDAARAR